MAFPEPARPGLFQIRNKGIDEFHERFAREGRIGHGIGLKVLEDLVIAALAVQADLFLGAKHVERSL